MHEINTHVHISGALMGCMFGAQIICSGLCATDLPPLSLAPEPAPLPPAPPPPSTFEHACGMHVHLLVHVCAPAPVAMRATAGVGMLLGLQTG